MTRNIVPLIIVCIIILFIIIVLLVAYLFSISKNRKRKNTDIGDCSFEEECTTAEENINQLKDSLDICAAEYGSKYSVSIPLFTLREDNTESYTNNKKNIHMVIRKKNHTVYDRNTLLTVGLHELAHVLCRADDCKTKSGNAHGPGFHLVLERLTEIAENKIGYDSKVNIDIEYPIT